MSFNTLEEAKAEILRLQQENDKITKERDTLSENNKKTAEELEKVRTINQEYFLQLSAQYSKEDEDPDEGEPETPTLEEFADKINI